MMRSILDEMAARSWDPGCCSIIRRNVIHLEVFPHKDERGWLEKRNKHEGVGSYFLCLRLDGLRSVSTESDSYFSLTMCSGLGKSLA